MLEISKVKLEYFEEIHGVIQNETSSIAREDRLSERNILAKLIGCSNVISPIGYPWIIPGKARSLSLHAISPDVFYSRNI